MATNTLLPANPKKIATPIGVPGGVYVDDQGNTSYQGYTTPHPDVPGGSYAPGLVGGGALPDIPGSALPGLPPRYFVGDEYLPASKLSTDDMIALQAILEAGGFYTGDHVVGVWGPADIEAYRKALGSANASGEAVDDLLKRAATAPKSDTTQKRLPNVIALTNPEDIRQTLRDTAQHLYSGDLSPEQEDAFISSYQQMQASADQQAYDLGETGGTVTAAPSLGAAAEAELRKQKPEQIFASEFGNGVAALGKSFGAPGGGWL